MLTELSMLLRKGLIGWFLSHDLSECRVASIMSVLAARLHLNEFERAKDAICEHALLASYLISSHGLLVARERRVGRHENGSGVKKVRRILPL